MYHLDVFSGIGGWGLAAKEAGFTTVGFCEIEPRCRAFLESTYGIYVQPDIRKLDGKQYQGIMLYTASPPCQPASRAGNQRGEKDDRWLWDEALRVCFQAGAPWCVFENPPGILDVGIDGILSELERHSYACQTFNIPACAVGSAQLRHRIWIVGHSERARELQSQGSKCEQWRRFSDTIKVSLEDTMCQQDRRNHKRRVVNESRGASESSENCLANSHEEHREEHSRRHQLQEAGGEVSLGWNPSWGDSEWLQCGDGKLRRCPPECLGVDYGIPTSLLGALGNSIVPQEAREILKTIAQVEEIFSDSETG